MLTRVTLSAALVLLTAIVLGLPGAHAAEELGPVRHIVLFDLKDDVQPAQLAKVSAALETMQTAVPLIASAEFVENLSSNTRNQGYTHGLYMSFASEEDLKAYGPHPGHEAFKKVLGPLVEQVLVFDYTVQP